MDAGLEFQPGRTDPIAYDRQATTHLVRLTNGPVEMALEELRTAEFTFESMRHLHTAAIDVELAYRQCIPVTAILSLKGVDDSTISAFLQLFMRCQTVVLNNMDRHLDLSSSYTIRDPEVLLSDVRATMCFAVESLYAAMKHMPDGRSAMAAFHEMASVSEVIVQSMYDNYAGRFSETALSSPTALVEEYLTALTSRHLGSGFYSSSIMGGLAYAGFEIDDALRELLVDLRRLRQRVDELADLFEDAATGLISYPVALALESPAYGHAITTAVQRLWSNVKALLSVADRDDAARTSSMVTEDAAVRREFAVLLANIVESGAIRRCYDEAHRLWISITERLAVREMPIRDPLRIVVDLKRAFLERLMDQDLVDHPPPHSFEDVRREGICAA